LFSFILTASSLLTNTLSNSTKYSSVYTYNLYACLCSDSDVTTISTTSSFDSITNSYDCLLKVSSLPSILTNDFSSLAVTTILWIPSLETTTSYSVSEIFVTSFTTVFSSPSIISVSSTTIFPILLSLLAFLILKTYCFLTLPSTFSTSMLTSVTSSNTSTFSTTTFTCFSPSLIPTFEVSTFVIALTSTIAAFLDSVPSVFVISPMFSTISSTISSGRLTTTSYSVSVICSALISFTYISFNETT